MSDRLAQRLSAHRTAALQIEVARHPQVALAALVHGMVQTVLQERHYGHDLPLGVSLKVQDRLEGMAPDWPESPAAVALRELQQVAGEACRRTAPNCSPRCWRRRKTNWCGCWPCAWLPRWTW
jgi:ParB family chromosome partitioning protein